jgi:2-dehydropantoate 2-reductase
MKVLIVGAGAVGSILGAKLVQGGLDVTFVARGRRAQQLREQGLRIAGLERLSAPVRVVENPAELREADVLVIATKTYDTEAALVSVRHISAGHAMGLQNGVYKDEQVARCFGAEKTLGAVAAFGGELMEDGVVTWTVYEHLCIGRFPAGRSASIDAIGAAFNGAGFRTVVSPRVQSIEWSKYVVFVGLLPLAALARLETCRMLQDPDLARVAVMLYHEMGQLAAKLGIPLDDHGAMARVKTIIGLGVEEAVASLQLSGAALAARGATGHKVSTLQDIEHGRRLEIDEIMGYAVRKAESAGLPMPTVETCYRMVAGLDRALQARRAAPDKPLFSQL